eukprot:jgi/Mesvir1/28108/Mv04692-RA.1
MQAALSLHRAVAPTLATDSLPLSGFRSCAVRRQSPFQRKSFLGERICVPINTSSHSIASKPNAQPDLRCRAAVGVTAFPAGKRKARVDLPAILLQVTCDDVLSSEGSSIVEAALEGGATAFLLADDRGGGKLYDAACTLKTLLRGRAVFLVEDRADIVAAAAADGVLLTNQGLPTVVAVNMMNGAGTGKGGSRLQLVARVVLSAEEGVVALQEGADLIVLAPSSEAPGALAELTSITTALRPRSTVPVVVALPLKDALLLEGVLANEGSGRGGKAFGASSLLKAGADGLLITRKALRGAGDNPTGARKLVSSAKSLFQAEKAEKAAEATASNNGGPPVSTMERQLLGEDVEELVEQERAVITQLLELLEVATPEIPELPLLRDALKQLDELFLLVIVGEFNSGKSSVINAMLGRDILPSGILPTTNEISVLKYCASTDEERVVQLSDGTYERFCATDFLREVNIVDTPGTNVILERQQRLTEEFVPRSDLVLFVLSADRPFTESEVTFLKYIRKWGKKVVFLLNKIDLLSTRGEIDEVVAFVASNAQRLLQVDSARVFPITSRMAMKAKLASKSDPAALANDSRWAGSGFADMEDFIFGFLGGKQGGPGGAERVRLKLETPVLVAKALTNSAGALLEEQAARAAADTRAVKSIEAQVRAYGENMEKDSAAQRRRVVKLIETVAGRAEAFVDSTLRVANIGELSAYIFGGGGDPNSLPVQANFERDIMRDGYIDLQAATDEHSGWLDKNHARQLAYYRGFMKKRWPEGPAGGMQNPPTKEEEEAETPRGFFASLPFLSGVRKQDASADGEGEGEVAMRRVELPQLDQEAAAQLLEEELREATLGTFGGAAGAIGFAFVLTTVLQNPLEDLLALLLGAGGMFIAGLYLPLRRADAKAKIRRTAAKFAEQVEEIMREETEASIKETEAAIQDLVAPYAEAAAAETDRVAGLETQRQKLDSNLETLQRKVRRIG